MLQKITKAFGVDATFFANEDSLRLLAAGTSENHVASNLFMVAVALVLVMSISSESSRRWVSGDREDKVVSYNLRHPNRGVSVE